MALKNPPLTEEHLPIIEQGIEQAKEAEKHLELAKQVGLDVEQLAKGNADTLSRLQKIKSVYFPGR